MQETFARLVRTTVWADFVFPAGGKADRQLGMCFDGLCREVVSVSAERLSDFCICQAYAISGYDTAYRKNGTFRIHSERKPSTAISAQERNAATGRTGG